VFTFEVLKEAAVIYILVLTLVALALREDTAYVDSTRVKAQPQQLQER